MKKILILILLISSCKNDSIRKSYNENGELMEEYEVNSIGQKHGLYILHYTNGQIHQKRFYQNGLVHGKTLDYYPNGMVELVATFNHDLVDGKVLYYGKNGNLEMIKFFKDDTLLIDKRYHQNGKLSVLMSKIAFKKTYLYNSIVEFDENGKQTDVSTYVEWRIANDNLFIDLAKGFKKDTLKVEIVKDFRSKETIRKIMFVNQDKLKFKLNPGDYHKSRLNIIVHDFNREKNLYLDSEGVPHLYSPWSHYYIQIDKGEKPKKYNLDPISW